MEPKFHEDWCKNGHTRRRKSQKPQKWTLKNIFLSKIPSNVELLKQVPESSHQTVFFWLEPIYRDINFLLKCLPAQCVLDYTWWPFIKYYLCNINNLALGFYKIKRGPEFLCLKLCQLNICTSPSWIWIPAKRMSQKNPWRRMSQKNPTPLCRPMSIFCPGLFGNNSAHYEAKNWEIGPQWQYLIQGKANIWWNEF